MPKGKRKPPRYDTEGRLMKWCCGAKHYEIADLDHFAPNLGYSDGLDGYCRACRKEYNRMRRTGKNFGVSDVRGDVADILETPAVPESLHRLEDEADRCIDQLYQQLGLASVGGNRLDKIVAYIAALETKMADLAEQVEMAAG
jgi:hypothetical protein